MDFIIFAQMPGFFFSEKLRLHEDLPTLKSCDDIQCDCKLHHIKKDVSLKAVVKTQTPTFIYICNACAMCIGYSELLTFGMKITCVCVKCHRKL